MDRRQEARRTRNTGAWWRHGVPCGRQRTHARWGLVFLGVATAVTTWLVVGTAAPRQATAPVRITIHNVSFVPRELTIPVGTHVTWVNDGGRHQIVADEGTFFSRLLTTAQQQFVHQFLRPGAFPYHCAIHGGPGGQGMAGVVTVVERTP